MTTLTPPPSFSTRALNPDDAAAYLDIRLQALGETPPAFGSLPHTEPDLTRTQARLAPHHERAFFGIFHEERLVGITRVYLDDAPNEKHRAHLASLYVRPHFRAHGCGKTLVHKAIDWAAEHPGVRRINLTVVTGQSAAIGLYKSLGFRIYGTEPEAFSKNGRFYDEHLMTLELPR